MDFNSKLNEIFCLKPLNESILLQDGEYTIEDTPHQPIDPDGLPDEDKFGGTTKTYYLKRNNQILTTIKINDYIIIDNKEYITHPTIKKFLSKNPQYAYYYALGVLKSRFQLGEKTISQDPTWAYLYAMHVLGSRFKLGEPAISQDPTWAYYYARFILGSRFPQGEPAISTDPRYAYIYATNILKSRWPEAEKTISTDDQYWDEYKEYFKITE